MKALIDGALHNIPDDITSNDDITKWDNCFFVYNSTSSSGRIYYKQDDSTWIEIAKDVNYSLPGAYCFKLPYYQEKTKYAIYSTSSSSGYILLDCLSGKIVVQEIYKIEDSLFIGMNNDRSKSCILYRHFGDRKWFLSDSIGNILLKKAYLRFLSQDSFDGIWLLESKSAEEEKSGVFFYFRGKVKLIVPEENENVSYNGAFEDSDGTLWFPTIKVGNGEFSQIYTLNGTPFSV